MTTKNETAQHTPGPWQTRPEWGENGLRVWGADSYGVADILIRRSITDVDPSAEEKANATLIAAAPDLLAACEAALDAMVQQSDKWATVEEFGSPAWTAEVTAREAQAEQTRHVRESLRAAIAKAKGE